MIGVWGRTYLRHLQRGEDNGSAAFSADQAERRSMSQGPRTRVRLDGHVFRVVRSSSAVVVYQRGEDKAFHSIFNSRKDRTSSDLIDRILEAEREAHAHDR